MAVEDLTHQVIEMTVKATPPLAVTGLSFFGIAVPDIVGVLTIVYLVIHIGYIVTKWIRGK